MSEVRSMAERPTRRILPELTPENDAFWTGGADGELRILRCGDCGVWIQPPTPRCYVCRGESVSPQAASGRATIHALTINHHGWIDDFRAPYAVAIVELDEQPGLRLTTNIVEADLNELFIGMRVEVQFEEFEGVWYPVFRPMRDSADG